MWTQSLTPLRCHKEIETQRRTLTTQWLPFQIKFSLSLLFAFDSNFQLNHTFAKVPTPNKDTSSDKKEAIILKIVGKWVFEACTLVISHANITGALEECAAETLEKLAGSLNALM